MIRVKMSRATRLDFIDSELYIAHDGFPTTDRSLARIYPDFEAAAADGEKAQRTFGPQWTVVVETELNS